MSELKERLRADLTTAMKDRDETRTRTLRMVLAEISKEEVSGSAAHELDDAAIERALVNAPLVTGNRTKLLHDGPETFRAIFKAIHDAKHYVLLEYYIFENVVSGGEHLADLLIQKRREGVDVAIIYDGYGSSGTPGTFFDRLRAAGVKIVEFHPPNPPKAHNGYSINDRDHRKILIADGTTAILGGVNLYTGYERHPPATVAAPSATSAWRRRVSRPPVNPSRRTSAAVRS